MSGLVEVAAGEGTLTTVTKSTRGLTIPSHGLTSKELCTSGQLSASGTTSPKRLSLPHNPLQDHHRAHKHPCSKTTALSFPPRLPLCDPCLPTPKKSVVCSMDVQEIILFYRSCSLLFVMFHRGPIAELGSTCWQANPTVQGLSGCDWVSGRIT